MKRDGNVKGARFCAGCHDPVPFFSGAFDDPIYDDPDYDLAADPNAQAGITCTVCHSISHINSPRGNGDYTIDEPIHYPFAFAENPALRWVNRQLVKAKPQFHKQTFLKPLHKSTEFCGVCHKVHLPEELNDYRWLRGQNHYDSFLLSGVSGHSVSSFYYPPVADSNCNRCHMPRVAVTHSMDRPNFGARMDEAGLYSNDHFFPGANTGIPYLLRDEMPNAQQAIDAHRELLEGCVQVDIFGVRDEGRIDGELQPTLGGAPRLKPGGTYLLQVVLRTMTLGHLFTEGTADSNQIWLDVEAEWNGKVLGRSGGQRERDGAVDPWSHFVNAFVLDRDGNRINRRNAEDIFVPLYNNQIPPGAADVVNYRLQVPENAEGSIRIHAALKFRKFDTEIMRFVTGDPDYVNDLPVITVGGDDMVFPIESSSGEVTEEVSPAESAAMPRPGPSPPTRPLWQRWNDYGIGLLRRGQLRQAEAAFQEVEALGNPNGPLNLARVYLQEGRVTKEAPEALRRAREIGGGANEWSILWFSALVNKQLGDLEAAITNLRQIDEGGFEQATGRGMDFSKDYRMINQLADSVYLSGLRQRGESRQARRQELMENARDLYLRTLSLEPENADAHYGIRRVYEELGEEALAAEHDRLHRKYKLNDNARDAAIAAARKKYPAANQAAERVVIFDLHREGAYGVGPQDSPARVESE